LKMGVVRSPAQAHSPGGMFDAHCHSARSAAESKNLCA